MRNIAGSDLFFLPFGYFDVKCFLFAVTIDRYFGYFTDMKTGDDAGEFPAGFNFFAIYLIPGLVLHMMTRSILAL